MPSLEESLTEHLAQFHTAPILFLGSGLTRRYLELDDWETLLNYLSSLTSKPYAYYKSTADGGLPMAASLIANEFSANWWEDSIYEDMRSNFADLCQTKSSPLKILISEYIKEKVSTALKNPSYKDEIAYLKTAVIDGIITTNWDLFLEYIFPEFKPYIGQKDILFNTPLSIGEIYKIHGCCSQPNSLVVTDVDYKEFEDKNPYLAAKLLAFFIEHPVIFMGYSMADENIQTILKSITNCLNQEEINKLRDRLIFVEWLPDSTGEMINGTLNQNGKIFPIKNIRTDSFLPVFMALNSFKRKFPAPLLRRLKEHLYEIILTNDPKDRLYVQDISQKPDGKSNIEVVFGIGAISKIQTVGYKGLTRHDVAHDVVFNDRSYDPKKIITDVLPKLLGYNAIFKYLKQAGYITDKGISNSVPQKGKLKIAARQSAFAAGEFYRKKSSQIIVDAPDIATLHEKYGIDGVLYYTAFYGRDAIDLEYLRAFLKENFNALINSTDPNKKTNFGKLICLYDYLAYR